MSRENTRQSLNLTYRTPYHWAHEGDVLHLLQIKKKIEMSTKESGWEVRDSSLKKLEDSLNGIKSPDDRITVWAWSQCEGYDYVCKELIFKRIRNLNIFFIEEAWW